MKGLHIQGVLRTPVNIFNGLLRLELKRVTKVRSTSVEQLAHRLRFLQIKAGLIWAIMLPTKDLLWRWEIQMWFPNHPLEKDQNLVKHLLRNWRLISQRSRLLHYVQIQSDTLEMFHYFRLSVKVNKYYKLWYYRKRHKENLFLNWNILLIIKIFLFLKILDPLILDKLESHFHPVYNNFEKRKPSFSDIHLFL